MQIAEQPLDEEESFEESEKTNKEDDLDFFSKLMRNKIDFSLELLLQRIT